MHCLAVLFLFALDGNLTSHPGGKLEFEDSRGWTLCRVPSPESLN